MSSVETGEMSAAEAGQMSLTKPFRRHSRIMMGQSSDLSRIYPGFISDASRTYLGCILDLSSFIFHFSRIYFGFILENSRGGPWGFCLEWYRNYPGIISELSRRGGVRNSWSERPVPLAKVRIMVLKQTPSNDLPAMA